MKVKGVVVKKEGSKLIIDIKPKVRTIKTESGEITIPSWIVPEKLPKEGAIVRIIYREKNAE